MSCDPLYYYPTSQQQALWKAVQQMGEVGPNTQIGNTQTGSTGPNQVDQTITRGVDEAEEEMLGVAWTADDGAGVGYDVETVSTGRNDAC